MTKNSVISLLTKLGLNKTETAIYLSCLQNGPSTLNQIAEDTQIKRPTVYVYIDPLKQKGFLSESKEKNKRIFIAENADGIDTIIEQKNEKLEEEQQTLKGIKSDLHFFKTALANLSESNKKPELHKPSIKFFEGKEGIRKAMADDLNATEVVLTYANDEHVRQFIDDINQDHIKKRIKHNIKKKALFVQTPTVEEHVQGYDKDFTEIRILKSPITFETEVSIYNGKVVFMAYENEQYSAFIIENKLIYQMLKSMFLSQWEEAKIID